MRPESSIQATAAWALGRSSPHLRERFTARYGHDDIAIRDFTAGPACHVGIVDLTTLMPALGQHFDG